MANLSDTEIIKALECCVSEQCDCDDCLINDYCREHSDEMIKQILDLINRLKAENERLKSSIKDVNSYLSEGDFAKGIALIIRLVKEMG